MPLVGCLAPCADSAANLIPNSNHVAIATGLSMFGALCTLLCFVGYGAEWTGDICISAGGQTQCFSDIGALLQQSGSSSWTVFEYSFGKDLPLGATWHGAPAAKVASACLLIALLLAISSIVIMLQQQKKATVNVYLLIVCWVFLMISFTYFAAHEETLGSTTLSLKPEPTWGWMIHIVSIFFYMPAIFFALAAAGNASSEAKEMLPGRLDQEAGGGQVNIQLGQTVR